ncbi:hypothetical protein BU17DRAFT_71820 [Hysterangium stoloniferum]|nr:hypothetical protein BU17DRAFT_71820 [Hysterangium stoloniferum]
MLTISSLYYILTFTVVFVNAILLPREILNPRSGSYGIELSGTWFTQNGVAGACGKVHRDSDHVVALETAKYAHGANCWRTISITDAKSGKSSTGVVADECPTCGGKNNIDLSVGLFKEFDTLDTGEIKGSPYGE